jgi:hypothetical protein
MTDEPPMEDLRALWQNQQTDGGRMSAADVRQKSQELQERAHRRVLAIYATGAANAGLPVILMWFLPELRLALAYLAVTAVVLVAFVRRRSAIRTIPSDMTPAQGLTFYRRLLERERDFRRDSARWFTVGPGLNIVVLGLAYVSSPFFHGTVLELSLMAAVLVMHVIVLTYGAGKLRGEARKYQLKLDGASD